MTCIVSPPSYPFEEGESIFCPNILSNAFDRCPGPCCCRGDNDELLKDVSEGNSVVLKGKAIICLHLAAYQRNMISEDVEPS